MEVTKTKHKKLVYIKPNLDHKSTHYYIKQISKAKMVHRQQNKCHPQRCLLDHFKATLDFSIGLICYCGQILLECCS